MKNSAMNATYDVYIIIYQAMLGYSPIGIPSIFMLTISIFGINGNVDEKHLSSMDIKYITMVIAQLYCDNIFKTSSSIKSKSREHRSINVLLPY